MPSSLPPARDLVGRTSFVPALAVLFLIALVARVAWVSDDAFITLRTVDHFVHGRGLVWNAGYRVQAFTHPLWMFALAIPYAIGREPYFGTLALSLLVDVALLVVLFRDVLRDDAARLFALVALATSQAFLEYGTSGLENPLSHLLLVLAYREYVKESRSVPKTLLPIGLLLVTRHDLGLLVLPWTLDVLWESRRAPASSRKLGLFALLAPLLLWSAFATFYFGAPLPNTAYAKLGGGVERSILVENGFEYLLSSLIYDPLTPLAVFAGIAAGARGADARRRNAALGIALYVVYVLYVGGDFMRGRFFTAPMLVAVMVLGDRLALLPPRLATSAGIAWLAVFLMSAQLRPEESATHIDVRGIADERAFWANGTGIEVAGSGRPMPNHPHVHEGRANAFAVRNGSRAVVRANTGGMRGFYAGPDAYVIEWYGLTDPVLAREPAMRQVAMRTGHLLRHVDDDYIAMLEDLTHGRPYRCRGEPIRCRLFEDALLATHGPLFAEGRLGAIFRLTFGRPDWGEMEEHYRRPTLRTYELAELATPVPPRTPWDAPITRRFEDHGIAIRVPSGTHASTLAFAVDDGDRYRIHFQRAGRTLASILVGPGPNAGMAQHSRSIPTDVRGRFDRLLVEPVFGDGSYAIGDVHLR